MLVAGENELVVTFEAPVDAAERLSQELGPRPQVNHHPYNAVRKMASNYGWDWGPDVATVGIWKPIRLEFFSDVRIASVRPLATLDGDRGVLAAHVELAWAGAPGDVTVAVSVGEVSVATTALAGQESVLVTAVVEDVERWWPRGHGAQPLYPVTVEVSRGPRRARVGRSRRLPHGHARRRPRRGRGAIHNRGERRARVRPRRETGSPTTRSSPAGHSASYRRRSATRSTPA